MGLSIHYSGTIRSQSLINELAIETADICKSLDWKYRFLNRPNEYNLEGIIFSPQDCEPVMFTFLPDNNMCSYVHLMFSDTYDEKQFSKELMYTSSTKTQFASADAHIALIKLIRFLSNKYFSSFKLSDEGEYWETNDEKTFRKNFARYESALNAVDDVLNNMPDVHTESTDSFADRIEKELKKRFGGLDKSN
jgi:hypothetical protein